MRLNNIFALVLMITSLGLPTLTHAHSGGLNAKGCHAGSKPYHCHRPQTATPTNSPKVKKSMTGICHAKNTRYYQQTKRFTAYDTVKKCIASGGRMPRN